MFRAYCAERNTQYGIDGVCVHKSESKIFSHAFLEDYPVSYEVEAEVGTVARRNDEAITRHEAN